MIKSYIDKASRDIADGKNSKAARERLPKFLFQKARERLALLDKAQSGLDLSIPALKYEELKGKKKGTYSIRINNKYRVTFKWIGQDVEVVWVGDYHDEKK